MFVLIEYKKPFAIITDNSIEKIETAIKEEYSLKSVTLPEPFNYPDWGNTTEVSYTGIDDNDEVYDGEFEITKIVNY